MFIVQGVIRVIGDPKAVRAMCPPNSSPRAQPHEHLGSAPGARKPHLASAVQDAERLGHARASLVLDVYGHALPGADRQLTARADSLYG